MSTQTAIPDIIFFAVLSVPLGLALASLAILHGEAITARRTALLSTRLWS